MNVAHRVDLDIANLAELGFYYFADGLFATGDAMGFDKLSEKFNVHRFASIYRQTDVNYSR